MEYVVSFAPASIEGEISRIDKVNQQAKKDSELVVPPIIFNPDSQIKK